MVDPVETLHSCPISGTKMSHEPQPIEETQMQVESTVLREMSIK